MKAVGLDTSVVLRLLTGEPKSQASAALELVQTTHDQGMDVCVSDLVVTEVLFALQHHYDVPLTEAVETLAGFLRSPMITPIGHALSILEEYAGGKPGIMDRMIRMDYLDHAHQILTFDRSFARQPQVRLVTAAR